MERQSLPPILARVSLCSTLAQSLSSFHSVDWLHKGLNSDNILYFGDETEKFDLNRPHIAGFSTSRPSDRTDMTEAPILRSSVGCIQAFARSIWRAKSSFHKSYDIYALDVILTEIATWKPIDVIMCIGNVMETTRDELRGVYKRLEREEMDFLAEIASLYGNAYSQVISVCLRAREDKRLACKAELGS
ncbi:hypothetical protein BKA67DRAFT_587007 [Truncatella angustata]|uniref:Protein kinase domain-containing protein n=1 Tax=Truncatella angustata TaxID=152316 RepID=A0A9P8RJA1_9PEZI|nr:uncharacterized protein BKA67DRAFT_587007 [Truncatella angustata]KAH6645136.1 hypothetical protein BKA67DRAFT_587007 [Truncatella angustata]